MRTMNDAAPFSLAGSSLGDPRHICAFFGSDEEEYRVLLPFIRDGFAAGDRAIHVVNNEEREDHLQRLARVGLDTASLEASGQLEVRSSAETYLRDGRFDQDRMLEVFKGLSDSTSGHGYPRNRIVCRMDWAAAGRSFVDNVIEFESRVNDLWSQRRDVVICSYHLRQFSGDAVIDIMRTHPMVIIGGFLQRNPFFVPPPQFLPDFRNRRADESASHSPRV